MHCMYYVLKEVQRHKKQWAQNLTYSRLNYPLMLTPHMCTHITHHITRCGFIIIGVLLLHQNTQHYHCINCIFSRCFQRSVKQLLQSNNCEKLQHCCFRLLDLAYSHTSPFLEISLFYTSPCLKRFLKSFSCSFSLWFWWCYFLFQASNYDLVLWDQVAASRSHWIQWYVLACS